jgi:hypothetical protein
MRTRALSLAALAVIGGIVVSGAGRSDASDDNPRARRADAIARAQVWMPTHIPAMDVRRGPAGRRAFAFRETVNCVYSDKDLAGHSPKFACTSEGDDLKVKYGGDNAEVYAEVAATRLLWALGFGADRMYPVRVVCRDCPETLPGILLRNGDRLFEPAAIERKMSGRELKPDSSWEWSELGAVRQDRGGAPLAHRDALTLLAVILQHTDSKPEQQRIVCRDEDGPADGCARPFMMINDLGLTFGGPNRFNANARAMNLLAWAATPIWTDDSRCVGNIQRSVTGTLDDPSISEAGRAFLAGLLAQLSDDQIAGLFEAARVTLRLRDPEDARSGFASVAEWIEVFKRKRGEIAGRRCQ